jgi:hypothetical protein
VLGHTVGRVLVFVACAGLMQVGTAFDPVRSRAATETMQLCAAQPATGQCAEAPRKAPFTPDPCSAVLPHRQPTDADPHGVSTPAAADARTPERCCAGWWAGPRGPPLSPVR